MPAKGVSLHIGLNRVDPAHYGGWDGRLTACEFDASDMEAIAKAKGFTTQVLLTQQATAETVMLSIKQVAGRLKNGDIFLLTYSGHGGQVPDTNDDEPDGQDETWVLYDRMLVDDELYTLWSKFAPGVRIIMLSDSCHSGSVSRAMPSYTQIYGTAEIQYRALPDLVAKKTYQANKDLYDGIQNVHHRGDQANVPATVLLISGCQDNQLSLDGKRNGLFTEKLKKVWNGGKFEGGYRVFRRKIAELMPPSQTPKYSRVGAPNAEFERQKPFTV